MPFNVVAIIKKLGASALLTAGLIMSAATMAAAESYEGISEAIAEMLSNGAPIEEVIVLGGRSDGTTFQVYVYPINEDDPTYNWDAAVTKEGEFAIEGFGEFKYFVIENAAYSACSTRIWNRSYPFAVLVREWCKNTGNPASHEVKASLRYPAFLGGSGVNTDYYDCDVTSDKNKIPKETRDNVCGP